MPEVSTFPRRTLGWFAAIGALSAASPALGQAAKGGGAAGSATGAEAVDGLKSVIEEHNKAFNAHDVKGVLKTIAPNGVLIGTAPGEIWAGHEEIADAFQHFFADFDAGKQEFENLWRDGGIRGDLAWLMASHKVTMTKGAKSHQFALNTSMTFEKVDGKWLVRAMHFSNLTSGVPAADAKKS